MFRLFGFFHVFFNGGVFFNVQRPENSHIVRCFSTFSLCLLWKRFTSMHVVWQLRCSILSWVRICVSLLAYFLQSVSFTTYLHVVYTFYMIRLGPWINHFKDIYISYMCVCHIAVRLLLRTQDVACNHNLAHWTLASIGSKIVAHPPLPDAINKFQTLFLTNEEMNTFLPGGEYFHLDFDLDVVPFDDWCELFVWWR